MALPTQYNFVGGLSDPGGLGPKSLFEIGQVMRCSLWLYVNGALADTTNQVVSLVAISAIGSSLPITLVHDGVGQWHQDFTALLKGLYRFNWQITTVNPGAVSLNCRVAEQAALL